MSRIVTQPIPVFSDIDGNPLEDGYIFIGERGADPETNPISVYWDAELTTPATNIRTKGGMPLNGTEAGRLYVGESFSIRVKNKRNDTVFTNLTADEPDGWIILTAGRKAFDEKLTTGLSGDGWYQVAYIPAVSTYSGNAIFNIAIAGNGTRRETITVLASFNNDGTARTSANTEVKILGASGGASVSLTWIEGIRIAKNDSSADGAFLEVYVDDDSGFQLLVTMIGNSGLYNVPPYTSTGWVLMSAVLSTGLTPDGSTASFLVAGSESVFDQAEIVNPFYCSKLDSDSLYCTLDSPVPIRPDVSGGTITFPSTALIVRDGAAVSANLTNAIGASISNVSLVTPYKIKFRLNVNSGTPFASHNIGPLMLLCNGTGGKIEWT